MSFNLFDKINPAQYRSRLPVSFDNSLDLYEQVIAVIEYFNLVIENSNEVTKETILLRNQFEQYKIKLDTEYKDFTDEIRLSLLPENLTKTLQAWYDSGKLGEIINKEIFDHKVDIANYNTDMATMQNKINAINSGFVDSVATLQALNTKYPTGVAGQVLVRADNNWYYWNDSWLIGGQFIASEIGNQSITDRKLARDTLGINAVNFVTKSNNLFNPKMWRKGLYVTVLNGKLNYSVNADYDCFLFVVEPNTKYFVSTANFLVYQFDIADNSLGFTGNADTVVNNFVVTSLPTASYIAISVKKTNLNHDDIVVAKGETLPVEITKNTLSETIEIPKANISSNKQLIDNANVVETQYAFQPPAIPVKYGEKIINKIGFKTGAVGAKPYVFKNALGVTIEDKEYGVGVTIPNIITVPLNAKTLQFNIFKSLPNFTFSTKDVKNIMAFKGTTMPDYFVPFGEEIDNVVFKQSFTNQMIEKIESQTVNTIYKVKKDGTGDFTSFKTAYSTVPEFSTIELYNSIEFTDEHTSLEWQNTNCYGYMTRKNIKVVGIGDYGSIKIRADLPEGTDASHVSRISTLHVVEGDFKFENIQFVGGNVRYALHDDDYRTTGDVRFRLCKFLKEKNKGTYPTAVGGGWYDVETDKYFDTCEFETLWDNMYKDHSPISYHSRINQTKPHDLVMDNCTFKIGGQGSHLRYGGMKGTTGVNSNIILTGNRLNRIFLMEEGYGSVGIDARLILQNNKENLEVSVRVNTGMYSPIIDSLEPIVVKTYEQAWTN